MASKSFLKPLPTILSPNPSKKWQFTMTLRIMQSFQQWLGELRLKWSFFTALLNSIAKTFQSFETAKYSATGRQGFLWRVGIITITWNRSKLRPWIRRKYVIMRSTILPGQRIPILGKKITLYMTNHDQNTKPFPRSYPLHGTEIIRAAVLINTFYHGTRRRSLL